MNEQVEPSKAFCEVLRQQRLSRGYSHHSLGIKSGLPGKYIYELECGNQKPYLSTVFKLASAFGYSASGFLNIVERRINGTDREFELR